MNDRGYHLVPPVELCERIPQGTFDETAFVWKYMFQRWYLAPNPSRNVKRSILRWNKKWLIYPAPTLQEVLEKIKKDSGVEIEYSGIRINGGVHVFPMEATEALKLWFKIKEVV